MNRLRIKTQPSVVPLAKGFQFIEEILRDDALAALLWMPVLLCAGLCAY